MEETLKYLNYAGLLAYDKKIKQVIKKNEVLSTDKTINITSGSINGDNVIPTDLSINIDPNDKFLSKSASGLINNLKIGKFDLDTITSVFGADAANIAAAYALLDKNNQPITGTNGNEVVVIPKDSSLLSVELLHADTTDKPTYSEDGVWTDIASTKQTEENRALCFAYRLANGSISVLAVRVGLFLTQSEAGKGLVTDSTGTINIDLNTGTPLIIDTNGRLSFDLTNINKDIAAAKTTIVEGTINSNNTDTTATVGSMGITKTALADGHDSYEFTLKNIASHNDLQTLKTNINNTLGVNVDTYGQNGPTGNYIGKKGSSDTIVSDLEALDSKLKESADITDNLTPITSAEINSLFS